jgi:hypothetical protein
MNKADRERIAASLIAAATKHGATVERCDEGRNVGYRGASIALTFRLNGVACQVSVDDLHGGFEGLAAWFNDYRNGDWTTRYFTFGFETVIGQARARPHHKATSYDSWDVLAARISAEFRKAAKGEAFTA